MTTTTSVTMEDRVRDLRELYVLRGEYLVAVVVRMLLEDVLGEGRYLQALERLKGIKAQAMRKRRDIARVETSVTQLQENVKSYGREFQAVKDVLDLSREEVEEYGGIKGLSERVKGLQKANGLVKVKNETVAKRVRAEAAELRKAKVALRETKETEKLEKEKRMRLERLCRDLASEISTMRKEVRAMKAAWNALKGDVDNLKNQVNRGETVVWTTLQDVLASGILPDETSPKWSLESTVRERLAALGFDSERAKHKKNSSDAVT